ncbi:MAG: alpha/beta fold hydrolase [bacterium]|nr:alpha/beta fold hydrolase [bacterium]
MKKQIIIIHGGDTFETYEEYLKFLKDWPVDLNRYRLGKIEWKKNLHKTLGEDYDIILPEMPNRINAKYSEWQIWFDKFVPLLESEVILIGHSMGGSFLAKYLAENIFPKKIKGLFLIAPPFDGDSEYPLASFALPTDLSQLASQPEKIFLYQSQDDPVVPFAELEKYRKNLPNATVRIFSDRGHFMQVELPEIIQDIKSL